MTECTLNALAFYFTFSHFIDWMYWDRSGRKIPGCLSVRVCVYVCLCECMRVYRKPSGQKRLFFDIEILNNDNWILVFDNSIIYIEK